MRRAAVLVPAAMIAFAANSLLCRVALRDGAIDAGSFTVIRLVSGAATLALVARLRGARGAPQGSWGAAAALFAYAAAFSYAYVALPAAVGALLLFGAVQVTMIGWGLARGERIRGLKLAGFALAVAGLASLLAPGVTAPPPGSAALMLAAGLAWGAYSLFGRGGGDPIAATAGNFVRAVPFVAVLAAFAWPHASAGAAGVLYAVASGALASGLGYAIWYTALPALAATTAATVQLSVPVIAAVGGVAFLGEAPTLRLAACSAAILGGIALVVRSGARR